MTNTPDTGKRYILWNPASPKPPKKVFRSHKAALDCAEWAASKSPGERFHVCELKDSVCLKRKERP